MFLAAGLSPPSLLEDPGAASGVAFTDHEKGLTSEIHSDLRQPARPGWALRLVPQSPTELMEALPSWAGLGCTRSGLNPAPPPPPSTFPLLFLKGAVSYLHF